MIAELLRHPLTQSEVDILYARANGTKTPVICEEFHVTPYTLKSKEKIIRQKLGARNRTSAVANAIWMGIIDLDQIEIKSLP